MKKFPMIYAAVLALVFVAGCATTTTTWRKTNVSKEQLAKDLSMCSKKAGLLFEKTAYQGSPMASSSQASYDSRLGEPFEKCMSKIGYRKEKK